MKRIAVLSVLCIVFLLTSVGPLWAGADIFCAVENSYDRQLTGVSFAASGLVTFPMGQTIAGQVMNPTTLAGDGFRDV
jgi:hypothetical protein